MTYRVALRHHVERRMRVDLELLAPITADEDGDYAYVAADGPVVWVRPGLDMKPTPVRVTSIAVVGVKKTAALLTELNEWNNRVPLVRFVWSRGVVRVWGDLVVQSVEPGELGHLVRHVAVNAKRVSDIVTVAYGGSAPWLVDENEPSQGIG